MEQEQELDSFNPTGLVDMADMDFSLGLDSWFELN